MPRNSSILVIGALFGLIGLVIVATPMFWPPTAPASAPAVQPLVPTAPTAPTAPSVDFPQSVVEAVSRTVLFAGGVSAVVCAALFGLAVIVHRRFMRRRMALTGQSARMFMQASDAETREANARVIAALAAEGAAPTGFATLVGAGGQADREAAVLTFLEARAATVRRWMHLRLRLAAHACASGGRCAACAGAIRCRKSERGIAYSSWSKRHETVVVASRTTACDPAPC